MTDTADDLRSVVHEAGAYAEVSDHALARRGGMGDRAAFTELFTRLFPSTLRFALRMLDGEEQLAEDAVQEAWIKAWRALPDFRGDSRVSTWLFSIVARQALDVRRRTRPLPVDHQMLEPLATRAAGPSDTQDPAHTALAQDLWETLATALSELPWRQRASWLLRELEGLSYEEIAQILNTTPTVVRGQLHRARRNLAIRMEQWR